MPVHSTPLPPLRGSEFDESRERRVAREITSFGKKFREIGPLLSLSLSLSLSLRSFFSRDTLDLRLPPGNPGGRAERGLVIRIVVIRDPAVD